MSGRRRLGISAQPHTEPQREQGGDAEGERKESVVSLLGHSSHEKMNDPSDQGRGDSRDPIGRKLLQDSDRPLL
jgi:hypothetical protein